MISLKMIGLDQGELDHSDAQDEIEQTATDQVDLLDRIGIDRVNDELSSAWRLVNSTTFQNPMESDLNVLREPTGVEFDQIDEEDLYLDQDHGSLKNLNIKLGTSELPRFSCAAHKMNIE